MQEEQRIGIISSYFAKLGVAAISLENTLRIGDIIHVKGRTTDFEQEVESMQIDRNDVEEAYKGQDIGVKVIERVRPNDKVFKVNV